ncbi:CRISPR-associated helicase Cas3 family protein [Alcanivorax sp. S71-1-4]|uniref:CRISPR-associated helicase Cas3' n=1 Tax=Alcanivorax sp. S71-1-4 TaxID=1177159 RepID=UPI00135B262A|nr:CRISPR-associated helicase Cas3' [Alcanivorax sp. S71-1-4]KAF0805179.1 CRISPR-associated helicase Cas3 family protein [Alcanivorax sp. S71-1-4]
MKKKDRLAFSAMPMAARVIWAKSGDATGHGLLAHLLDVAAVAETMLEFEPASTRGWAATQFGLSPKYAVRWIAFLVGLHDFGKAIPGFQAKWPEGMRADQTHDLTFPAIACGVTAHSCATAALLYRQLRPLTDADASWLSAAIQAISAHHGYHFLSGEVNRARPSNEPAEWGLARQTILHSYWQVMAPQDAPTLDELSLPAVNWLAGLTSTADWIASNAEWFPLGERRDDLSDYYQHARELAVGALQRIGWTRARPLLDGPAETSALITRILGCEDLAARPLQQVGDDLLRETNGPALLLVEAPMGEGKTELAFLAHLRLQAANGHRGLYVALPTQATGNAMFRRALTFLDQFIDGHADVQLVHGGAAMNEEVQHLRDIDHSRAESLSASAWFSQRKRPLLSPYGVGTIDQALFAALNVKHHFVRLWGLSNRVIVLDEVHAYDTYTSGLIEALLQWLKALGSSVVLMSATLPQSRRDALIRAWGLEAGQIPDLSYPRLLLADDTGIRAEHFTARALAPIHLSGLAENLEALADKAISLLTESGCGALIVNTVNRAQVLYADLRERLDRDVQLLLFHARFPADERNQHERRILDLFGTGGARPQRALLIATQVVEQSLDIDFDFMLSDLAPVDLLLQRAGRLHRHDRPRPSCHEDARLWVAGLQGDVLPDLKETAWGFVYDPYILGRTWALLRQESTLHLPGDIDRLVQVVYGDAPLLDDVEEAVRDFIEIDAYGEHLAKVKKERTESFNISIDPQAEPAVAYNNKPRGNEEGDGLGLRNRTRLGRESITLVPVELSGTGWRVGDVSFRPDCPVDDTTARLLYSRQIKVSQTALVKHFQGSELAESFATHSLLKDFYPLPLQEGRYEQNSLRLRMDKELGLICEINK